jgi:hypothetical protein
MLTRSAHSTTLELRSPSSAGRTRRGPSEAGHAPLHGESSPGARKGALQAPASCSAARCPRSLTSRRCRTLVALAPPELTAGLAGLRSLAGATGGRTVASSERLLRRRLCHPEVRAARSALSPRNPFARRRRDPSAHTLPVAPDAARRFRGDETSRSSRGSAGRPDERKVRSDNRGDAELACDATTRSSARRSESPRDVASSHRPPTRVAERSAEKWLGVHQPSRRLANRQECCPQAIRRADRRRT